MGFDKGKKNPCVSWRCYSMLPTSRHAWNKQQQIMSHLEPPWPSSSATWSLFCGLLVLFIWKQELFLTGQSACTSRLLAFYGRNSLPVRKTDMYTSYNYINYTLCLYLYRMIETHVHSSSKNLNTLNGCMNFWLVLYMYIFLASYIIELHRKLFRFKDKHNLTCKPQVWCLHGKPC